MLRDYIFEIGRAIEGALNGDNATAIAYLNQLAQNLEANGELEAAKRLKQITAGGKRKRAHLARGGASTASTKAVALDILSPRKPADTPSTLPVDSEFALPMAKIGKAALNDVQLVLNLQAEAVIEQFINYIDQSPLLKKWNVEVNSSLLLWGPPGCGKTRTADYIAAKLGLPLVTAKVDAIVSSYLGSTAKNLAQLFEYAASFPCVLFLDELDALGKMRDDDHEMGELKRVVISLLQNMDSLTPGQVVLAATNHPHLLDPALWRRFAYKVHLSEPDAEQRRQLLSNFLGDWADETTILFLTTMSEGMNGALIKFLADECIRDSILTTFQEQGQQRITFETIVRVWGTVNQTPKDIEGQGTNLDLLGSSNIIYRLREKDSKVWTQSRLADLLGITQGRVSKVLSQEEATVENISHTDIETA